MRILRSGKSRKQITCVCNALLEYERSDIQNDTDAVGNEYIECPECYSQIVLENDIDEDDEKILTVDNIVFPDDFYDSEGAKEVSDEEVTLRVKRCMKEIMNDEGDWTRDDEDDCNAYRFSHSGDTFVLVIKDEGEYEVFVGKNVFSTWVCE